MYDIIIVGAGPAGMTAALYARRCGRSVLLLESETFGGQIAASPQVENYPAVAQTSGMELVDTLLSQVTQLAADIDVQHVTGVEKLDGSFLVHAGEESLRCRALILATGVRHRTLGLAQEAAYIGRGISFCAVCDGALFKNREVAVVGGGSAALQEALYLSGICAKVHLIHRRDVFRGEKELIDRVCSRGNVCVHMNCRITKLHGNDRLEALTLHDGETDTMLAVDALFEAIGSLPSNDIFSSLVRLDEQGYIAAGEDCRTSCEGVFAAGDCRVKQIRQLTTAVADGTVAALNANDFLEHT